MEDIFFIFVIIIFVLLDISVVIFIFIIIMHALYAFLFNGNLLYSKNMSV